MRLPFFLIIALPLFVGWLLYHLLVKRDFDRIKNDAFVGGIFLALSTLLVYFLFI